MGFFIQYARDKNVPYPGEPRVDVPVNVSELLQTYKATLRQWLSIRAWLWPLATSYMLMTEVESLPAVPLALVASKAACVCGCGTMRQQLANKWTVEQTKGHRISDDPSHRQCHPVTWRSDKFCGLGAFVEALRRRYIRDRATSIAT